MGKELGEELLAAFLVYVVIKNVEYVESDSSLNHLYDTVKKHESHRSRAQEEPKAQEKQYPVDMCRKVLEEISKGHNRRSQ